LVLNELADCLELRVLEREILINANNFKMRSIVIIILLLQLNSYVTSSNRRICPSGSVFVDTFAKCYTFLKAPTTWANAEQQCRSLFPPDGHLLSVSSGFENSFINGQ
jgi:hypothetical protein